MSISIAARIASKIGFASHQNAVPVLRELEITNEGEETFETLVLSIAADPEFLEVRTWRIDRLAGNSTLHINERDLRLRGGYLNELNETLRGSVTLRVESGEEVLAESHVPVELLARSEWGGLATMAELLPAFVMPNDRAVDKLLKSTSNVLRRAGKPDAIDGYRSESRSRVWEMVSAMWSAVTGHQISYVLPPASFEMQGQKVRTPTNILDQGVGTCLDTALLFAALIEQAGLNPLIVATQGHAFVGAWLQPQEFSSLITEDAGSLRKRVELQEMVLFETTLATQAPAPRFDQAINAAMRQISLENEEDFLMAIDIRRARMQKIKPLSTAETISKPHPTPDDEVTTELVKAPALPGFDIEIDEEPRTEADRVMLWQRKLLDLTTRNRLLHLPSNAKAVPLHCPDPGLLEDRLAEGKKFRVRALPDFAAGGRDAGLYRQRTHQVLADEFAASALDRNEVSSTLDEKKLDAWLVDLYRTSRRDIEEGGANTLYLALGFLRWKKSPLETRTYRAPLILLPVKLERRSAVSGVVLSLHEDEPRFNLTLLELLRHDFELSIPGLDGSLPRDDCGIDVQGVWDTVRRYVRDLQGFEVVEDVAIGTFSFAKYLMWKDLVDRHEQLKESPVVRHLMERGDQPFEVAAAFPDVDELDELVDPSQIFAPLPADSSQLAAIVASGNGCDFVLDGPPGTGKSQTIANMIAHNLALGRRVLFVAEKRAALDVVYRRLAEKGLGDFCLELHSNKAVKRDVIQQLGRAWDAHDILSKEEWQREAGEVRRLRDGLNEVVHLLHNVHPNGLTLHEAIGRVVRDHDASTPRFYWPADTSHDSDTVARYREIARQLGIAGGRVVHLPEQLKVLEASNWSNAWQSSLVGAARSLRKHLDTLLEARDSLLGATHIQPCAPADLERLQNLLELTSAGLEMYGRDFSFAFTPDFPARSGAVRQAASLITEYRNLERELSTRYSPERIRRLDLDHYESALSEANARFWFFASLGRRNLAKQLMMDGGCSAVPDIISDLPLLRRLKKILLEVDRITPLVEGTPGWTGLTSDVVATVAAVELAERVRGSITSLAASPDDLISLRRSVSSLVVDANEMLAPDGSVALAHARLKQQVETYGSASSSMSKLADTDLDAGLDFEAQRALCRTIVEHEASLKAWCDWRRIENQALEVGLQPLVEIVVAGSVGPATEQLFITGYARWFAAVAIDREPRLKQLVTDIHADEIEAYRRLEDQLSRLSVRYIRAKLTGRIPDKNQVTRKDGYGILKHQLQLQRPRKPIRQLASEMGEAFTALAPCMLMSPLSIAQYLPTDQALFDLVIFDEASQITPWDAIGSIARGRQVVIAGDPRQMPPTNFFSRGSAVVEDEGSTEEDMESILDECLAAGVPRHSLDWHYRSRHESLIAFSNSRYYENRLVTFPAPELHDRAVSWRRVDGVYAKGRTRTNTVEAKAMVGEIVRRLTDPAFVEAGYTLGVVTMSAVQQQLVEDLLDHERTRNPTLERHFSGDLTEPVFVKNLETVQGDERDVILIGIGYGPTEPGARTMSMSFGPLNREGGWRRLNVAATRARREMVLFTSFDAGMIDLNRTSARAVRDLKHFIEFADRGPRALAEAIEGSVGEYESPFEEAVAQALTRRGWTVVPQIGVSRFRIDLGIVHPDRPGDYLLGVECDGASYHSAATARDRDKVREAVLKGLGWTLLRIWSTDWWVDREGAADRLHASIEQALNDARKSAEVEEVYANLHENAVEAVLEESQSAGSDHTDVTESVQIEPVPLDKETVDVAGVKRQLPLSGLRSEQVKASRGTYRTTDFSRMTQLIDPERFYDPSYDYVLFTLLTHVVRQEAPIADFLLVERIARAHGFQRSGRLIRERIDGLATKHFHVARGFDSDYFVWPDETTRQEWNSFRVPATEADIRMVEAIAPEEIAAAATACVGDDRAIEIARIFDIRRLSSSARTLIEAVLALSSPADV